jgi:GNAT superfamily N-acetyltransferase
MIEYRRENYSDVIDELRPLLPVHWAELGLRLVETPLDPDFGFYERANRAGLLFAYTARLNGRLIGYCIMTVVPRHAHYNHKFARDDTIWVAPEHRNVGAAGGLFDFMEADLSKDEPCVIVIESRIGHPALEYLLQARGYSITGSLYARRFA